jgi:hypothetical protein
VRCSAPELMPHSGDDETSRRGRYRVRTRSSGKDGAVPNSVRRWDGRGDGARTVAGGDRGEAVRGEDDEAADRWGPRARGSGRERGRRGLTSGAGVSACAGASAEWAGRWAEGEGIAGVGGGSGRGRGLDSAQLGGRGFLFFFLFSNFYIHFYILFF